MKVLGNITAVILFIIFSTIINGYTFSVLWDWFIVSTFGMPELTIFQSIGLAIVVGFLTYKEDKTNKVKEAKDVLIEGFSTIISKALMYLAIGFVVVNFI